MKRIVSVLLGIALMMTMALALAGCNKQNNDTAKAVPATTAVTTQTVENEPQSKKTETTEKKEAGKNTNAKIAQPEEKKEQSSTQKTAPSAAQNSNLKATQKNVPTTVQKAAQPATQTKTQTAQKAVQPAAQTTSKPETQAAEQKPVQPEPQNTVTPTAQTDNQTGSVEAKTQSVENKSDNTAALYAGTYAFDENFTVEVKSTVANTVVVHIYRTTETAKQTEWILTGTIDENGVLSYGDCVRRNNTFDETGSVQSADLVYYGGKGTLTFKNGAMTWDDHAENIADGMNFTKVG